MKRRAFVRELERKGCRLLRHGSRHDIYVTDTPAGQRQRVPRHAEIGDDLAKHSRKHLGID